MNRKYYHPMWPNMIGCFERCQNIYPKLVWEESPFSGKKRIRVITYDLHRKRPEGEDFARVMFGNETVDAIESGKVKKRGKWVEQ
jgi:hypothetical protein